tara:strand:+ start:617 stop:748 length:132 start_codon:yes stop_codon:yes gene_type:complete
MNTKKIEQKLRRAWFQTQMTEFVPGVNVAPWPVAAPAYREEDH